MTLHPNHNTNKYLAGSETTKRSEVVERVATSSGGYLTAGVAGDDGEVDGGRESASY